MRRSAASAARSPDSQAPPTVPHMVSCTASPARTDAVARPAPSGCLRASAPPGAAADDRAEHPWLVVPARDVRALRSPSSRRCRTARPATRARNRPSRRRPWPRGRGRTAADLDHVHSGVPDTLAEQRRGARPGRLLEHQIVALQIERIARQLQRDVIEAAERELAERVEMALAAGRGSNLILLGASTPVDAVTIAVRRDEPALGGRRARPRSRVTSRRASPACRAAPAGRRRASPAARRSPGGRTRRRRARPSAAEVLRRDLVEVLAAAVRARARIRRSIASRRDPRQRAARTRRRPCRARPPAMARLRAHRSRRDSPPARPRAHCAGRCAPAGRAAPDRCRARCAPRAWPPD